MHLISRLFSLIALIVLLVNGTGTASAQVDTESRYAQCVADSDPSLAYRCDQFASRALTFAGPAGEQVAVFCSDGFVSFSVRLNGLEGVYFAGAPGQIHCDIAAISSILPAGYQAVMNTSPHDGWIIMVGVESMWPVAWQCRDGVLAVVSMNQYGPKLVKHDVTSDCGPMLPQVA